MKKLLAFTLAETLIVMGIIGVIAALTIPNLNQSTGNREKIAKVKKNIFKLRRCLGSCNRNLRTLWGMDDKR